MGYNQAFLAMLVKWFSVKWLNRFVNFHRAYSIYTLFLESAFIITNYSIINYIDIPFINI